MSLTNKLPSYNRKEHFYLYCIVDYELPGESGKLQCLYSVCSIVIHFSATWLVTIELGG